MLPADEGPSFTRADLRKARHEDLKRLARFLGLHRDIDKMSQKQLASLIVWLLGRRKKYERGFY
jgi:hypothetical protein